MFDDSGQRQVSYFEMILYGILLFIVADLRMVEFLLWPQVCIKYNSANED